MFINITDSKLADNKGSSTGLVHYLEKENRIHNEEPQHWFNGQNTSIYAYEVKSKIDGNIAKLGKDDAKFYLINISPSQKEIAFLKKHYGTEGAKEQMKEFAIRVMDSYARNFKRNGIESSKDLVWFAKLENYRYYSYIDSEVKQGIRKRGERKPGDQMHIQIIVSRKDATNKIKLSPQNNSRGRNEEHSKKMGQFDRVAFKQSGERLFDDLFNFDRQLKETMAYSNVQKNGTLSQRLKMKELEEKNAGWNIDNAETIRDNNQSKELQQFVPEVFDWNEGLAISIDINIQDDVDDEAIHGRNRQRKRHARTNTR